jgi:accessory gene regulator protein AgrB
MIDTHLSLLSSILNFALFGRTGLSVLAFCLGAVVPYNLHSHFILPLGVPHFTNILQYSYDWNGNCQYKQLCTTLHSKKKVSFIPHLFDSWMLQQIMLLSLFFPSQTIILEILWDRIRISEQLTWANNALRNSASDIIIQCLCGWYCWSGRNAQ